MRLIIFSKKTLITFAIVLILLVTIIMVYITYNRAEPIMKEMLIKKL